MRLLYLGLLAPLSCLLPFPIAIKVKIGKQTAFQDILQAYQEIVPVLVRRIYGFLTMFINPYVDLVRLGSKG